MNEEDDDEETDGIKVPFLMRKVSVIPCGIRGILVDKSWSLLINRAVTNARNVRYLGSRFINFHLTRLLQVTRKTRQSKSSTFISVPRNWYASSRRRRIQ